MSTNEPVDTRKCAKHRARTHLIHGYPRTGRWDYDHHVVPPMTASATFRLDSVERGSRGFAEFAHTPRGGIEHGPIYVYDRMDEPTRGMLEENLAIAEGGEMALCFASGMGAISAALNTLVAGGQQIIAHEVLYGCTYSLLTHWMPRSNVEVNIIDLNDYCLPRAD